MTKRILGKIHLNKTGTQKPIMYSKHDFICFTCDRYRPLTELKFIKDAGGRTRRICLSCEQQAKEELARLMRHDLTVN